MHAHCTCAVHVFAWVAAVKCSHVMFECSVVDTQYKDDVAVAERSANTGSVTSQRDRSLMSDHSPYDLRLKSLKIFALQYFIVPTLYIL